jgi:hypothetical protein
MSFDHDAHQQDLLDDLREEVLRRVNRRLPACAPVDCRVSWDGPRIKVDLAGAPTTDLRRRAMSVLVLDAVRATGHTYGQVDVTYNDGVQPHA